MKIVKYDDIVQTVANLAKNACTIITPDIKKSFLKARDSEKSPLGKSIIEKLLTNAEISEKSGVPLCQDTGMSVVIVTMGQNVQIDGGYIEDAINEGVAKGYTEGYLRKSVVNDPIYERSNTTNNTPAIIHVKLVKEDIFNIKVAAKGFGSENKSRLKMLVPADGIEGVKEFFLETVKLAGPNACPPLVIGVGIGGTMEKAAMMAKEAAIRETDSKNPDVRYAKLEDELLELANKTGVGPQGLGGTNTALKVNVEWYPTHIAGLPVAVNINCHAARHAEANL